MPKTLPGIDRRYPDNIKRTCWEGRLPVARFPPAVNATAARLGAASSLSVRRVIDGLGEGHVHKSCVAPQNKGNGSRDELELRASPAAAEPSQDPIETDPDRRTPSAVEVFAHKQHPRAA